MQRDPRVAAEQRVPQAWCGVRRVLVVRLDNVGDVVMAGPALRALREALPDARLTLMASPAGAAAAPLLPWIDDVLVHRAVWQDASGSMPLDPGREIALVERLRAGRFDAAVILTSFRQSPYPAAYACYLAGIPIRLGRSGQFGGSILSPCVPPVDDAVHQVERNLSLLEAAGFRPRRRDLEVAVPAAAREHADRLLEARAIPRWARFVLLVPGASAAARRYDAGRFRSVAGMLADCAGLRVVVAGSEREAGLVVEVASARPSIVALAGRTDVPALAALVARAAVVVCNDSGPMHLADALRTPVVVLFSGTDLEPQWAPRSTRSALLRRPTACSPCYAFDCPYGLPCLDVPPETVVTETLALLRPVHAQSQYDTRRETVDAVAPRADLARPRKLPVRPRADAA